MAAQHVNRRFAASSWLAACGAAWPRQCELCADWGARPLCVSCTARFAQPVPRCPGCALPGDADRRCGACLRDPPRFDAAWAAADYGFPWDELITRFKFRQHAELAMALATLLAESVPAPLAGATQLLIPMPLSTARLRERGYNQAWELARRLGRQLGIETHPGLLQRWRDTPHQVGLSRQAREANLRDALWVDPLHTQRIRGRQVALIDDVMTTGASANAAAHALRQAGATQVQVWVVARTPREG